MDEMGVPVIEDDGFGYSATVELYGKDDYNNVVKVEISLINTVADLRESNYPNIILFYLYTKDRSNDSIQIYVGDTDSLKRGQFDPKKPTVFVAHGWGNSHYSQACTYVRDAYLKHGDYNVILIDWNGLSKAEYFWVSNRVPKMSKYVASMIDFLETQGMDLSKTTIVGHSLGAHIAGLSSYYAKNKVNYVVALDPAGPNFYNKGPGTRVSKEDAKHVQVIHTNHILGTHAEMGDADFYVNGGKDQKGCFLPVLCPHARAYEYFAESINHKGFLARKCDNFTDYKLGKCKSNDAAYMGGATPDLNAKGIYHLTTHSKPPFAKH
ncbi:phospholipase A1 VesT1.02-like [Megachile rotundata]|uniref:phospholipase A1 VesT1.02-like n=1 Tax=Megachile rotundata TaxID=143995 RepID=UPI003FD3DDB5